MTCLHSALLLALLLSLLGATSQVALGCKSCVMLGKAEKAMFRAHSAACLPESHVDPKVVDEMLSGELVETPALKKHVYCVLLKCKIIGKDGKLQKTSVLGKMANRMDAKNATKILENCAHQAPGTSTPEDVAWNLFRCSYKKKAILFDYMPTGGASVADVHNTSY